MSADPPDTGRALAGAASLLDSGPGPARARTVVRLLRYALESALNAYWEALRPGEVPPQAPTGRRLRLLTATLPREFAHSTYTTWCRLSDAARPHPYELAPSVEELRSLQRATETAVEGLTPEPFRSGPASGASCTSGT